MIRTAFIADNISDVLVKVIHFTQLRRRVLHENLHHVGTPGFTPKDMPVREFAEALEMAVAEHLQHHRLLLCDTANIKFGPNNTMEAWPVPDPHAHALLQADRDKYTEFQIDKLLENCLNRRVAEELLRQKCGVEPPPLDTDLGELLAGDNPLEDLPAERETTD
jgi:flagellar basal body rod protein FlgB